MTSGTLRSNESDGRSVAAFPMSEVPLLCALLSDDLRWIFGSEVSASGALMGLWRLAGGGLAVLAGSGTVDGLTDRSAVSAEAGFGARLLIQVLIFVCRFSSLLSLVSLDRLSEWKSFQRNRTRPINSSAIREVVQVGQRGVEVRCGTLGMQGRAVLI